jgi:hypothetical protein
MVGLLQRENKDMGVEVCDLNFRVAEKPVNRVPFKAGGLSQNDKCDGLKLKICSAR